MIAPRLPESDPVLLERALTVASKIQDGFYKVQALSAIAPRLPESDPVLLGHALTIVDTIQDVYNRARALSAIAPRLPESNLMLMERALIAADTIQDDYSKAVALSAIAPRLPESEQRAVLERALTTADEIQSGFYKAAALSAIAPRLSESDPMLLKRALIAADTIQNDECKAQALSAIAPRLPESDSVLLERALIAADNIQNAEYKAQALSAIAPQISQSNLKAFLEATFSLSNAAESLASSATRLTKDFLQLYPSNKHSTALNIVKHISDDADKTKFLSALIPCLAVGLLPNALRLTQKTFKADRYRTETINNLVTYLPTDQTPEALNLIDQSIKNPYYQTAALVELIPLLSIEHFNDVLDLLEAKIALPQCRASILQAIAKALTTSEQMDKLTLVTSKAYPEVAPTEEDFLSEYQHLVERVFNLTYQLKEPKRDDFSYERATSSIFSQLAPVLKHLAEPEQTNVLAAVKSLEDPGYQAAILIALAPHFKYFVQTFFTTYIGDDYRNLLRIKIQLANIDSPNPQDLRPIADQLNDDQTPYIKSPYRNAEVWVEVASHPAGKSYQTKALRAIQEIQNNAYLQTQYLQRLIPHLAYQQRLEVVNIINVISDPYHQASARVALARKFPESEFFEPALNDALALTPKDKGNIDEAEALSLLRKGQVKTIEQLSTLAIDMPELLPKIIKIAESDDSVATPDTTQEEKESQESNQQNNTFQKNIHRYGILVALAPHLPMRINREVKRTWCLSNTITDNLWDRALYLLARSYRDALTGGSLRNESAQDKDYLNLQDEIKALSQLLLMRDLEPPMAVGILGGWGGGKSYIMHLMQAQMTEVRSRKVDPALEAWNADPNHEKLSPYVGHIYQIKFDAWTFAKSDLWASLMQTIFFELDRQISLEQQLAKALSSEEKSKAQVLCEGGNYWSVLNESSDEERKWILQNVVQDEDRRKLLEAQPSQGGLWEIIAKAQVEDQVKLEATQKHLENKQAELAAERQQIRQKIAIQFEPILKTQQDERVKWADAFFGTSFILLRQRIGPQLFKQLNKTIFQELYGTSDSFESALSSTSILGDATNILGQWAEFDGAKVSANSQQQQPQPLPKDHGLWGELYRTLEKIASSKQALADLEKPPQPENVTPAANEAQSLASEEPSEQSLESPPQAAEAHSTAESQKEKTNSDQKKADLEREIETLLEQVTSLRFNILNVATNVVEKNSWRILWATATRWIKINAIPLLLVLIFTLLPLFLLFQLNIDATQPARQLTVKLGALIAPALPAAAMLINLLKSSTAWFEESRLALSEYETSITQQNRDREDRIKASIDQAVADNKHLQQLEQEVGDLEQQVEAQKAVIPTNLYASLADFVSGRLETNDYKQRLGLMHQVKEDLSDLSKKLLPPSHYDPRFATQVKNLKQAFPRGPARVVVYIDDLDRCPPRRVVQVLEAVQLLVKTPLFIAVLAIDERYITRALEQFYKGVLLRHGSPSGTDYLEKIIQLPYRVRPIMADTLETYLRSQVVIQDNATGGTKFSEFSRQEFKMLVDCCQQVDLSPRTLKRLTNVYKLFKIVCRTRGTKTTPQVQQAILALLALSGRYPNLMRGVFEAIETCFEERRDKAAAAAIDIRAKAKANSYANDYKVERITLHLQSPLRDFFKNYQLPDHDRYQQLEFDKLLHDALRTDILPPTLTLEAMTHEIFNLIRSFSFVGEIGEDPDDYRFSNQP
ncbi:hypothetical protein C8B47_03500 [filamentous cyanobacterium CCP4]|nr:hypothetical protein C8B47_03500 [filamentous cyanobacterium CCP4]